MKLEDFVGSQEEVTLMALRLLDGKQRCDALGIDERHYENYGVASYWFRLRQRELYMLEGRYPRHELVMAHAKLRDMFRAMVEHTGENAGPTLPDMGSSVAAITDKLEEAADAMASFSTLPHLKNHGSISGIFSRTGVLEVPRNIGAAVQAFLEVESTPFLAVVDPECLEDPTNPILSTLLGRECPVDGILVASGNKGETTLYTPLKKVGSCFEGYEMGGRYSNLLKTRDECGGEVVCRAPVADIDWTGMFSQAEATYGTDDMSVEDRAYYRLFPTLPRGLIIGGQYHYINGEKTTPSGKVVPNYIPEHEITTQMLASWWERIITLLNRHRVEGWITVFDVR